MTVILMSDPNDAKVTQDRGFKALFEASDLTPSPSSLPN